MTANYTKTYRVSGLDSSFQQVSLFKIYEIFTVLLWPYFYGTSIITTREEKQKIFSSNFFPKNPVYYRNCIGKTIFGIKLFLQ